MRLVAPTLSLFLSLVARLFSSDCQVCLLFHSQCLIAFLVCFDPLFVLGCAPLPI